MMPTVRATVRHAPGLVHWYYGAYPYTPCRLMAAYRAHVDSAWYIGREVVTCLECIAVRQRAAQR